MKARIFFLVVLVAVSMLVCTVTTAQTESEEITLASLHAEIRAVQMQLLDVQEELTRVRRDLRNVEWLCDSIESLCGDILSNLE